MTSRRPFVAVVGSVNDDTVISVNRLPAAGETVEGVDLARCQGGKGANQAVAAASMGARTCLVARVGDDEAGNRARESLSGAGVDLRFVRTEPDAPTGAAVVVRDRDGENLIVTTPGANATLTAEEVGSALTELPTAEAVVLACLEVPLDAVRAAARAARDRGFTFVLNPAPARPLPDDLLALVDVLTPNQHELSLLGGSLDAPVDHLLASGVGAVVVTAGRAGADLFRGDGSAPWHVAAFTVDVVDTTGAGDAFNGALAYALAHGDGLEGAVLAATAAGALATRGRGAQGSPPTSRQVDDLVGSLAPHKSIG